jgi:hypothetical protein
MPGRSFGSGTFGSGTFGGDLAPPLGVASDGVEATRGEIRRRIGTLAHVMVKAPASAASATGFTVPIYDYTADAFKGWRAYFEGQTRRVEGYDPATGIFTLNQRFGPFPQSGQIIELWHEDWSPEDVNDNINLAILDSYGTVYVPLRLSPADIAEDFKSLMIPAAFTHVTDVFASQPSTPGTWTQYLPVPTHTSVDLALERFAMAVDGDTIYLKPAVTADSTTADIVIRGYGRPALLTSDDDVAAVRADFLVYQAAAYMEAGRAEGSTLDPEEHSGRAANWLRLATAIKMQMRTPFDPNTVEVRV